MSIEVLLTELTAAIRENTTFLQRSIELATADKSAGDKPAPKKRNGRPTDVVVPIVAGIESDAADGEPAPIKNEVAGKTDGTVAPSAEVDMAHLRATTRAELLAYRDAVCEGEPASSDPGAAKLKATGAAKDVLKPFKAARFDDVKDDDLEKLRGHIKKAHDALTPAVEAADDLDLDDL